MAVHSMFTQNTSDASPAIMDVTVIIAHFYVLPICQITSQIIDEMYSQCNGIGN